MGLETDRVPGPAPVNTQVFLGETASVKRALWPGPKKELKA